MPVPGAGCRCWSGAGAAAGVVSWQSAPVWRCRKLAVQAAYILVPASRMSTGRGILPSYLGLCWCNLLFFLCFLRIQKKCEIPKPSSCNVNNFPSPRVLEGGQLQKVTITGFALGLLSSRVCPGSHDLNPPGFHLVAG